MKVADRKALKNGLSQLPLENLKRAHDYPYPFLLNGEIGKAKHC